MCQKGLKSKSQTIKGWKANISKLDLGFEATDILKNVFIK